MSDHDGAEYAIPAFSIEVSATCLDTHWVRTDSDLAVSQILDAIDESALQLLGSSSPSGDAPTNCISMVHSIITIGSWGVEQRVGIRRVCRAIGSIREAFAEKKTGIG